MVLQFFTSNARWLGAGLLLTFASGFGQTWFISLFAGEIRAAHGLSEGAWGGLYTAATLASAGLLLARGSWADTIAFSRLAPLLALAFAASAILVAWAPAVWLLGLGLFGLRFCGQGMFSHIAMTAMGRWFAARRGQAVAITSLGYPLAETTLPVVTVLAITWIGWRETWIISAGLLAIPIALALRWLLLESREKKSVLRETETPGLGGKHWQRADALRHWLLPALIPMLLTPGFIGTVIFFHQVHVAETKGWTLLSMTPGLTIYAACAVGTSFIAG
ncbi:MAG: MFS transporter, partial [Devosiaceae bacterium]|nr:MFS transporter [Devosiaceae bacterium MH13]